MKDMCRKKENVPAEMYTPAQRKVSEKLVEAIHQPGKKCLAFVDDFCVRYLEGTANDYVINDREELEKRILKEATLAAFCIRYDCSIEEGYELMCEIVSVGLSPTGVDPKVINLYREGDLDIRTFWYAYLWGRDHGVDHQDMEEFLSLASFGLSFDDALYGVTQYYDDLNKMDRAQCCEAEDIAFYTGHEIEEQETDFSGYERFDEEIDIDNIWYEDADDEDFC